MPEAQAIRVPRYFWIVGVLALLWNLMGAVDYLMTQTRNDAYMGQFTPEQLEYFYGFPVWLVACWAMAVWGGVLAAVLLLMRRKLAVTLFLISFLCVVVTSLHNFVFSQGAEIMGSSGIVFGVVIFLIALALVIYSRNMARKGVLA